jgi:hypothetical protein
MISLNLSELRKRRALLGVTVAIHGRRRERRGNVLVTKMVANSGPRVGIERDGSIRVADFRNTNQHFEGQNETGRGDHQQILSQARPLPNRAFDRPRLRQLRFRSDGSPPPQ